MRPIKLVLLILVLGCSQNIPVHTDLLNLHINSIKEIRSGIDILLSEKMELLNGKSIGLVTNNSGLDHKGIPNYKQLMKRKDVDLK